MVAPEHIVTGFLKRVKRRFHFTAANTIHDVFLSFLFGFLCVTMCVFVCGKTGRISAVILLEQPKCRIATSVVASGVWVKC